MDMLARPRPRQADPLPESDTRLSLPPRGQITTDRAALAAEVAEQVERYRRSLQQGPRSAADLLLPLLARLAARRAQP